MNLLFLKVTHCKGKATQKYCKVLLIVIFLQVSFPKTFPCHQGNGVCQKVWKKVEMAVKGLNGVNMLFLEKLLK